MQFVKDTDRKCWRNKIPQKLDLLEGTSEVLDQYDYKKRDDPINKCHMAAEGKGYDFFAVGNGGQCWAGKGDSYKIYSKMEKCPEHGKGFYGTTNIYEIVPRQVEGEQMYCKIK